MDMSETEFSHLRRAAAAAVNAHRKNPSAPLFLVCVICGTPVTASRHPNGRYFHHARTTDCPWYRNSSFTEEVTQAVERAAAKESARHRGMKMFVACIMARDPASEQVFLERVSYGNVLSGEWVKPDVRCAWRLAPGTPAIRVVFEIQLSRIPLTEVVKRDEFYKKEGIFVIWIFADGDENLSLMKDEKYFNRQNLFILDDAAVAASNRRGRLVLHCHYNRPVMTKDGALAAESASELVDLSQLTFSDRDFRPYYRDCEADFNHVKAIQDQVVPGLCSPELSESKPLYRLHDALIDFGRKHEKRGDDLSVLRTAADEASTPALQQGVRDLIETASTREGLVRLMSISLESPNMAGGLSPGQIVDAASKNELQRQFVWLFLEAWKAAQLPRGPVGPEARGLAVRLEKIRAEISAGDATHVPDEVLFSVALLLGLPSIKGGKFLKDALTQKYEACEKASVNWTSGAWHAPESKDKKCRGWAMRGFGHLYPAIKWRTILVKAEEARKCDVPIQEFIRQTALDSHLAPLSVATFLTQSRMLGPAR